MGVQQELQNCKAKRKYGSEAAAKKGARTQMLMGQATPDSASPDLREYYCEWCKGWHLTSKTG